MSDWVKIRIGGEADAAIAQTEPTEPVMDPTEASIPVPTEAPTMELPEASTTPADETEGEQADEGLY